MKNTFHHYKFKALRTIAMLNLAFPLHYSIWENAGMLLIIFAGINAISDAPVINQELSVLSGIVGFFMSWRMIIDIHDCFTIKD